MQGSGVGVVIRTGDHTLIGSIAGLASRTTQVQSTLQIEVNRFVRFISGMGVIMALIFFIIGVARGQPALYTFINGISSFFFFFLFLLCFGW